MGHAGHDQPQAATYDLVDLADQNLPNLDEPEPASSGNYTQPHTREWAHKVAGYDAFVFVTPEYNHGIPGQLKNALDFLYAEWNDKVAGIVCYGSNGGFRAAEQLKLTLNELQVAVVRAQVELSTYDDMERQTEWLPGTTSHPSARPCSLPSNVGPGRCARCGMPTRTRRPRAHRSRR